MNDQPGTGEELHQHYPSARRWYQDVQEWTGLRPAEIFAAQNGHHNEYRQGIGPIRQAAAAIATYDVLAECGLRPSVVCGLSLGALIGACLSGAVGRPDFFGLLMHMRHAPSPPADAPPQGLASLTLSADASVEGYLEDGLFLASDAGPVGNGDMRMVLLGGYRSSLEKLAAVLPPGTLQIFADRQVAIHTPLQQAVSDFLEPYLAEMTFRNPAVPLIACMEPRALTTANDIHDLFRRNLIAPVHFPYVADGLLAHDAQLGLILGPSNRMSRYRNSPIPLVHVESPKQVTEALTAVHEFHLNTAGVWSMSQ